MRTLAESRPECKSLHHILSKDFNFALVQAPNMFEAGTAKHVVLWPEVDNLGIIGLDCRLVGN